MRVTSAACALPQRSPRACRGDADVAAFLASLDTASAVTPQPAVALGGPEVGDTGEVVLQLTLGRYVVGCLRRGPDGHRHAYTGESKAFVVTGAVAGRDVPPSATATLGLLDFAFETTERWRAGTNMLRVENRGRQDHQVRIARLNPGVSAADWLKAEEPGDLSETVSGVARLGAGMVAYLPVELPPGSYVVYCLIPDSASGRPHIELGMMRAVRVE